MNFQAELSYIFNRYPSPTQTFLSREIEALQAMGFRVRVHALLSRPRTTGVDYFRWWEWGKLLIAVPRELWRMPSLLSDAWKMLRQHRPSSLENLGITLVAVAFAFCRAPRFRERRVGIIHGAWATGPATAAAVLSRLCGIPFSFGAHAYDIYRRGGDAFLAPKLRAARFVHTTTEANVASLREKAGGAAAKIVLARRGLAALPESVPDRQPHAAIRLLSVGRLVPKKGHVYQLAAAAWLRSNRFPFELRIAGDGPLRKKLEAVIRSLELSECVTLLGALNTDEVEKCYRWADVLWHTGIVDEEGDRDGLPNVIPEAFAHGLPVICGQTPGATEAVAHNQTGLVVDVTNAEALATAVKQLASDSKWRNRLGRNARRWVEQNFLVAQNAKILAQAFREAMDAQPRSEETVAISR